MGSFRSFGVVLLLTMTSVVVLWAQPGKMVLIEGGDYIPLYGSESENVSVNDFLLDVYPVTNQEYLEFVKNNPNWRKSTVKGIFADGNYLRTWKNDLIMGPEINPKSPVTNISWFAAKAFCNSKDKRLPTVDEWEFAAMADERSPDAREKETYNEYILSWYETPKTHTREIGSTFKNYYGVYDLHGIVWEWTFDFNSILLSGESRKDVDTDRNLFCGSGSVGASDLMNYAAFMRYSLRGSLKANYSVQNLGFRCAKSTY